MPKIVPSQVVSAIDGMFGPDRNELDRNKITFVYKNQVRALLSLLDLLPSDLVIPPFEEFKEYLQCQAALVSAINRWDVGGDTPVQNSPSGRDPVERIRKILLLCPDENPPPAPPLVHIGDAQARANVQEHIRAAWIDFNAREWNGATVFAASSAEAVLYWAIKNHPSFTPNPKRALDQQHLREYVDIAKSLGIIGGDTEKQLSLANEARNYVHAGKVARTGVACSKATALMALAGLETLLQDANFQTSLATTSP